jgi:hypothetical protein
MSPFTGSTATVDEKILPIFLAPWCFCLQFSRSLFSLLHLDAQLLLPQIQGTTTKTSIPPICGIVDRTQSPLQRNNISRSSRGMAANKFPFSTLMWSHRRSPPPFGYSTSAGDEQSFFLVSSPRLRRRKMPQRRLVRHCRTPISSSATSCKEINKNRIAQNQINCENKQTYKSKKPIQNGKGARCGAGAEAPVVRGRTACSRCSRACAG